MSEGVAVRDVGPYQLEAPLGRGGMGVVYRARHQATGESVALKTLDVVDPGLLHGIRREIAALAALRHPGVVRIVDHGMEGGVPWYAMELVAGRALSSLLHGAASPATASEGRAADPWWTVRLPSRDSAPEAPVDGRPPAPGPALDAARLDPLLRIAHALCETLGYLHGEGIVHRDLKPDNVLVRPDGAPVLLDFGLVARDAGALGREALEPSGDVVGTVAYMAPEQAEGGLVDARADLYGLGCILYEALTGRPPLLAVSPLETLARRMHEDPERPSASVADVPAELEELVMRLLARVPSQRLGYADEVARRLASMVPSGAGIQPRTAVRPYLYRPALAGRDDAVAWFDPALDRLAEGRGGLVLVGGESGVGKTRLATEVAARAARASFGVLLAECAPLADGGGQAPLSSLRSVLVAFADACRQRGPDEARRILGPHVETLAPYEPSLASGRPTPAAGATDEPGPAARRRLREGLGALLAALGTERPRLLVIDDLQWADELSLDFLAHAAGAGLLDRSGVLVAATYRTEERRDGVAALRQVAGVAECRLARLDGASVRLMVADMLAAEDPPAGMLAFLDRHGEGNPFFVAEYLRTAVARGLLRRPDGRWELLSAAAGFAELPLPSRLRDLVALRLDGLGAAARKLLAAASVLGRESAIDELTSVASIKERRLMAGAAELLARQVMEEPRPGCLRFLHDKLREVAYEAVPARTRRDLHRRAAASLDGLQGASRDERLADLAHHWDRGGDRPRARAGYRQAAFHASRRFASGEAERLFRAYLGLVDTPDAETVAAQIELAGNVILPEGRLAEAVAEQGRALDAARSLGDRRLLGWCMSAAAYVHWIAGDAAQAHRCYAEALEHLRAVGDRFNEGVAIGNLAQLLHRQRRVDEAAAMYRDAIALHTETGNAPSLLGSRINLAVLLQEQGRLDEAAATFLEALGEVRAAGNRRSEAIVLLSLGNVEQEKGDLASAVARYGQALELARGAAERRIEAYVLGNLAAAEHAQGRHESARVHRTRAVELAHEIGDKNCEATSLANIGADMTEHGDIEGGRAVLERALVLGREVEDRRIEGFCLVALATNLRLAGSPLDRATALATEAEQLFQGMGEAVELAKTLCQRGLVELAAGRPAEPCAARVREMVATVGIGDGAAVKEWLGRLERAIEDRERGRPVVRGESLRGLPAELQAWLEAEAGRS